MEHLVGSLKEKGVVSKTTLLAIEEVEIEQWKQIPVGYRIKLKQLIQSLKRHVTKEEGAREEIAVIEDIISKRKKEQVYVPIDR